MSSFALSIQRMGTADATLALAQVASWRSDDRWFSSGDVAALYTVLRIPSPSNLSNVLARLRDRSPAYLIATRSGGANQWAITPEGEERAEELIAEFDYTSIASQIEALPGAFFAAAEYPTLPPTLAPPGWAPGIKDFLDRNSFETNVFLMTRFPRSEDDDPIANAIQWMREGIAKAGLTLHTAADQQIVDDLWGNVGAHMWACRYGIGILEARYNSHTLNDNVLIELGSMLTLGRRCMILKDNQAPMPPTDLTAQIFKPVDLVDRDQILSRITEWVAKDLRIA